MQNVITIRIEVDDEYFDDDHDTGLTNDGFEALTEALTSSVAASVVEIVKGMRG